jgi:hypothetical protein
MEAEKACEAQDTGYMLTWLIIDCVDVVIML